MPEPTPLLGDVSATCLVTLFGRATESASREPLLRDPEAEAMVEALRPALAASDNRMHQRLAHGKLSGQAQVYLALRARRFDHWAAQFLERHPQGVIVNLGCGLDTRYQRLTEAGVAVERLLDLDLPEVIALKRRFVQQDPPRYRMLAHSVLDHRWMDEVSPPGEVPPPVLLLAEGLLMYLDPADVKALLLAMRNRFGDRHGGGGAELVAEMINGRWLTPFWRKQIQRKMQRKMGMDADFRFGIRRAADLQAWGEGIELLQDWSHFDEPERKIGVARWFRRFELFRTTQWVVRYRLC